MLCHWRHRSRNSLHCWKRLKGIDPDPLQGVSDTRWKRRERGKRRDADTFNRRPSQKQPFPSSKSPLAELCFHLLTWVFGAPRRTDPTAGRDRPAPWNPRSGFEGEGANQGDVSRPEQSGGRVTTTETKLIARSRLSPTKEVTGGRRATIAQEGGASASPCGRGADCAKAREPVRPREARSLRERARG